jgi:hypothetical protein
MMIDYIDDGLRVEKFSEKDYIIEDINNSDKLLHLEIIPFKIDDEHVNFTKEGKRYRDKIIDYYNNNNEFFQLGNHKLNPLFSSSYHFKANNFKQIFNQEGSMYISPDWEYKSSSTKVIRGYENSYEDLDKYKSYIFKDEKLGLDEMLDLRFGGQYGDSYILDFHEEDKKIFQRVDNNIPKLEENISLRGSKYLITGIEHKQFEKGVEELFPSDEKVFRQKLNVYLMKK